MTLLVISPDYASHLYPLATLATAWQAAGERVVVATGPATDDIVRGFGFEREHLQLGRGSNPGVIRAEEQPTGEDDALRGFFDATRRGAVETLLFQARARRDDLLWEPVQVGRAVLDVVDRVRPDAVVVDHLAFSARLALASVGVPHADVVLGHPTALPVGDEVYGCPPTFPRALVPNPDALAGLRTVCEEVRDAFTDEWNAAARVLSPGVPEVADAFAVTGDVLLLNYPEALHDPQRTALLPSHRFLGSAVRVEAPDAGVDAWVAGSGAPLVYVSLGSFLSVRGDVLARLVEALRGLDVRVALAHGSTPRAAFGALPGSWLVRESLPQVTLLRSAALAVTHGGNNSVTESLTAGVPMLVLPFSTDQFAGAASLESAGLATVLDPNTASTANLREALAALLGDAATAERVRAVASSLQASPGPDRAHEALTGAAVAGW
ncbi:glycosyltransferase [Phycicoccus sp. Soil748]|uniref:glycosyltransferase n=1 Tax=Phycicoccus sp. Soil748 TaxID=1736397 RepID=UPI0007037E99|nr:glycosyltransferase [Phycicoccus sp. Soil748]KRE55345.1 glycosyltransferase [Phycicoccus sp. Soil748]